MVVISMYEYKRSLPEKNGQYIVLSFSIHPLNSTSDIYLFNTSAGRPEKPFPSDSTVSLFHEIESFCP